MDNFSIVVKKRLKQANMLIPDFAERIGFSVQYVYDLLSRRKGCRWNEDSMQKACKILGIEIQFKSKSMPH